MTRRLLVQERRAPSLGAGATLSIGVHDPDGYYWRFTGIRA